MSQTLVNYYEQQFRLHIMLAVMNQEKLCLKDLLKQFVLNNEKDYLQINYAYLNVKRELIG